MVTKQTEKSKQKYEKKISQIVEDAILDQVDLNYIHAILLLNTMRVDELKKAKFTQTAARRAREDIKKELQGYF